VKDAPDLPPDDAELHAYVDGLLPPDRTAAVEAWLAGDPSARARVAAWRRQNALIRDLAAPVDGEALPPGLRPRRLLRRRGRERLRLAAAVALALLAGGGAGWLAHGRREPGIGPLDDPFLADIERSGNLAAAFAAGQAPETPDREALEAHLSGWLDHPLVVPDLAPFGLAFAGARTARTEDGDEVALLAYRGEAGAQLFLQLLHPGTATPPVLREAEGTVGGRVAYWPYDELRCLLAGDLPPDRLGAVAAAINAQLEAAEEG
jgi:anti-sigma factor RsiW